MNQSTSQLTQWKEWRGEGGGGGGRDKWKGERWRERKGGRGGRERQEGGRGRGRETGRRGGEEGRGEEEDITRKYPPNGVYMRVAVIRNPMTAPYKMRKM